MFQWFPGLQIIVWARHDVRVALILLRQGNPLRRVIVAACLRLGCHKRQEIRNALKGCITCTRFDWRYWSCLLVYSTYHHSHDFCRPVSQSIAASGYRLFTVGGHSPKNPNDPRKT